SKHLALPTWDKPAFACLSSRFPYGTKITREALTKVDTAERILQEEGFRMFRVRFHDERTARIEVGSPEIPLLLDGDRRERLVARLKDLGFTYVTLDLQGYRTGSMNEVLSAETKTRHTH
ncbi:MAG: TIGR00268 family protein, partial [Bacteroidetes bacterium]|nr:TIGR00268 family protein [Bacteroidota bacterium]